MLVREAWVARSATQWSGGARKSGLILSLVRASFPSLFRPVHSLKAFPFSSSEVFLPEFGAGGLLIGVAAFNRVGRGRPAPAPIRTGEPKFTAHSVMLA